MNFTAARQKIIPSSSDYTVGNVVRSEFAHLNQRIALPWAESVLVLCVWNHRHRLGLFLYNSMLMLENCVNNVDRNAGNKFFWSTENDSVHVYTYTTLFLASQRSRRGEREKKNKRWKKRWEEGYMYSECTYLLYMYVCICTGIRYMFSMYIYVYAHVSAYDAVGWPHWVLLCT